MKRQLKALFSRRSERKHFPCSEFVVRIQRQASKCNSQEHLDVALRDRLVAGINRPELQRRLLSEKDTSFQNLRAVCETTEDLNNSTQEPAVLLHQSWATPYQSQISRHVPKRKPKTKTCSSCGGLHPEEENKSQHATCYKCQKKGHIQKVCKSQKLPLR